MTLSINPLRHLTIFSPDAFGQRRVDVIGAGATGSRVVLELARIGVENIHIFDFDTIEGHNIANQVYGNKEIGLLKVEALAKIVENRTGTKITTHAERVDGTQTLGEIVFLLTDTMSSRKEIWDKGLKFRLRTKLLVETRMGAEEGRVYALNPSKLSHINGWEETLYSSNEAETSACGTSISVGPTAQIISGIAVWQMMTWFAIKNGKDDVLENEIIFSMRPFTYICRQF